MFNAMSLTVLRQLLSKCLCRNFPVKRMPDSVTDALAAAAKDIAIFAEKEGLRAHARSALIRTEDMEQIG